MTPPPTLRILRATLVAPWLAFAFALAGTAPASRAAEPPAAPTPDTGSASALRFRADALHETFERNAWGRPFALTSTQADDRLEGDITARLDHPFAEVARALDGADRWCDVLVLHLNTKQCLGQGHELHLRVGRKFNQPLQDAYALDFTYRAEARAPDYLRTALVAPEGPMGTRDYHIVVEAAPLDEHRTVLRLRYDYGFGTFARLAMQGYLATSGRVKVGFTITGRDAHGEPEYVTGLRGLVERNTMRYFLAIEAVLAAPTPAPSQTVAASATAAPAATAPLAALIDHRLEAWFDATEHYARQLHEVERAEYLATKHDELRRQAIANAVK